MNGNQSISLLLVPMQQRPLLLTTSCVAEIQNYSRPEDNYSETDWLLGDIIWRGQKIPVISFERMNNGRFAEFSASNHIAIMNRTTKIDEFPFYGIVIQGMPQPLTLMKEEIRKSAEEPGPIEAYRVMMRDIPASIPDMEILENNLKETIALLSVEH